MAASKATNESYRRANNATSAMTSETKYLFLGLRRGGSSIGCQLLIDLFSGSGKSFDDVVKRHYDLGTDVMDIPARDLSAAFRNTTLVGTFRDVPEVLLKAVPRNVKLIFLVRDPRDCVVSWYYARHRHPPALPGGEWKRCTLFDFIRHHDDLLPSLERLLEFAESRDTLLLRYEDMISDPVAFVTSVVSFVDFPVLQPACDSAIVSASFQQLAENNESHNRSGQAYAALRGLTGRDMRLLTERYEGFLQRFGYPLTTADLPTTPPMVDRRELDAIKRYVAGLSQENGYRIGEINELRERCDELSRENGMRIDEISSLRSEVQNLTELLHNVGRTFSSAFTAN